MSYHGVDKLDDGTWVVGRNQQYNNPEIKFIAASDVDPFPTKKEAEAFAAGYRKRDSEYTSRAGDRQAALNEAAKIVDDMANDARGVVGYDSGRETTTSVVLSMAACAIRRQDPNY